MKLLGHPYRCVSPHADETILPGETPSAHVVRLAELKARESGRSIGGGIIIGSDTVVVLDGDILGKPASPDEARAMLGRIQGRTHTVYTGFAVHDPESGAVSSGYETTEVTMRPMDGELIRRYVETGEPLDKAGAYGIQGYGAALVTSISGCYFNVMGLPLARLMDTLREFTHDAFGFFGLITESRR